MQADHGMGLTAGMALQALQAALFLILLSAASVCDMKNREIPDLLQAAIAALSLLCFSPWKLAGLLTALPYLLVALAYPGTDGIGGGDIKLAAATGVVLGLPGGLAASVMGLTGFIVYGLACSAGRGLQGQKGKKAYPAGPFLAAGAAIVYFLEMGGGSI